MRKKQLAITTIAIILGLAIAVSFYIQKTKNNISFSCNYDVTINTKGITLNQKINIKLYEKTGLITSFGEMQIGNKKYMIDRDIIFDYKKQNNFYTFRYDKEVKKLNDNTPKDLWHEVKPTTLEYNFSFYKIKNDVFLIKEHKIPIITCTKT